MSGVAIYQNVHTLAGRILHLDEHLKLLFNSYYEIFNSGVTLNRTSIENDIKALLKAERVSQEVSVIVRISLYYGGEIKLTIDERLLYSGYSLRCLSPRAQSVEFDAPYIEHSTSTREALFALADIAAERAAQQVAVRCCRGVVDMACSAQLFAVKGRDIITSSCSYSIEHRLAKEAINELNIRLIECDIRLEDIPTLDELFFVDYRGVTALSRCNGHYLMSIITDEVAEVMRSKYSTLLK